MKLLVSELKSFKSNSSSIKTRNTLPILSYLKFTKGAVTKNSLSEFIVQKITCDDEMLIDERLLMNFVDNTDAKEITVTKKGNRVTITDGETDIVSPTEDITFYPVNSSTEDDSILFDDQVMSAISVASNFIIDEQIHTARSMVFVGKDYVIGQNGSVGYAEKIGKGFPEICLYKEMLNAIKKFTEVQFSQNDSYYFFESGDCKFGFSKPELKFTDCTRVGTSKIDDLPKFSASRRELKRFNDLCISSSLTALKISSLTMNGGLNLEMIDTDRELGISRKIEATGTGNGKLHYNPEMMNILLKNVSDEIITFHQAENHCYITGDSGFQSLLMGMQ
jgi:hypothetical protein